MPWQLNEICVPQRLQQSQLGDGSVPREPSIGVDEPLAICGDGMIQAHVMTASY
jgi:hypothetical protein